MLVGSELWFAPVLDPGVNEIEIRLPAGHYQHAFTGQRYTSQGSHSPIVVPAPIGTPAVLYREGSQVGENFRRALVNRGVID